MIEKFSYLSVLGTSAKAGLVVGPDSHVQSGELDIRIRLHRTGSFYLAKRFTLVPASNNCVAGQEPWIPSMKRHHSDGMSSSLKIGLSARNVSEDAGLASVRPWRQDGGAGMRLRACFSCG